ncbi:MAG: CRISPR-associated protein Cas4 [Candidatus Syntropharchaeia archaeon]
MIRASEIGIYLNCPRQVYFISKGHRPEVQLENIILREISLSLPDDLEKIIQRIPREIPIVYKKEIGDVDPVILREVIFDMVNRLGNEWRERIENGEMFKMVPYKKECVINSEKLKLSGCVDKLFEIDEKLIPLLIKTGNCPDQGVWRKDRIQLTAYAILVEEEFDCSIERGFVEYIRNGEIRGVEIKRYDRRTVLQILKKIEKIKKGALPERKEISLCNRCSFKEICKVRKSLASKFF